VNFVLRYFLFCVCLVFCVSSFSCAVHKISGATAHPVQLRAMSGPWKLKIRLLPGFTGMDLPLDGWQAVNDPLNIMGTDASSAAIVIIYHFNTQEECRQAAAQTQDSGMVSTISVTSGYN
jgi:hypothetical protein